MMIKLTDSSKKWIYFIGFVICISYAVKILTYFSVDKMYEEDTIRLPKRCICTRYLFLDDTK